VVLHNYHHSRELYEVGAVASLAYHDPKKLRKIDPDKPVLVMPTSGPLAIPRKKNRGEHQRDHPPDHR
jgi:hypothetical protein